MNTTTPFPVNCPAHDPHPHQPRIVVPAHACDVHAHVCGPQEQYPLIANRLYTPPSATLQDYRHMLDTLGIERAVLVQPSIYGTDNRAMLDALKQDTQRLRGVAVVPFDVNVDELEALHAQGVRGVRCNIVDLKEDKGVLPMAGLKTLAKKINPLGWHIEFLMHVNEFPDLDVQLAQLPVPLAFGHLGYVPTTATETAGFEGLLRLAKDGQAWIKLTAPYRLTAQEYPYPSTLATAERLMAEVPQRLLWGSDWPHVFIRSGMPNDGDLFNLFAQWVNNPKLLEDILVKHPALLYNFS